MTGSPKAEGQPPAPSTGDRSGGSVRHIPATENGRTSATVRDSRNDTTGPVPTVPATACTAFVAGVRAGELRAVRAAARPRDGLAEKPRRTCAVGLLHRFTPYVLIVRARTRRAGPHPPAGREPGR